MQTKQKIYEIAKILFIENGYNKVSTNKIAEMSETNQGLITYYFKHKRNIASTIFKENYQILSAYLRSEVDVRRDPFLFNVTIDNMISRIMRQSENFSRFISDMVKDNIVIDTIYAGSQKNDIVIMIKNYVPESKDNLDKYFAKFVSLTFPASMHLQMAVNKGIDFSYDEFFEIMVRLNAFALDLKFEDSIFEDIIDKSNAIVQKILKEHPHLNKPEEYLFNMEVFNKSIVAKLLDL